MVSEGTLEPSIVAAALKKEIEFAMSLVKPGSKGDIPTAIRWMALRVQQLENEKNDTV